MVSFASPLFWQIHYLVTNLSKKNFKSNVAELNQLVGLYGEDARIFLLNCLVKDIDFRDARNQHKDTLKIQLLQHEITQASSKPNFTTFICEAIEGSASDYAKRSGTTHTIVTEDYLNNFCRALKLSIPQQVTIGLSFAQGENVENAAEATRFLKSKIPELSTCGSKLPSDALHALVFVLRVKEEFRADVAETDSFLASISSAHPNDMSSMEIAPLTMGDPDHVDCVLQADGDLISKLVSDVNASAVFHDLMEDVGYACTSSPKAFRTLLAEAGLENAPTIPPAQVAGMLVMISRTFNGLQAENGATLMAHLPFVCDSNSNDDLEVSNVQPGNTVNPFDTTKSNWDLDVIAEVLQKDFSSIKWIKVAEKLDREDTIMTNPQQFRILVSAFQKFSQMKFKTSTLLRPWKHAQAHMSILKAAIESPVEVISFGDSPNKLAPFEGADASQVPKNGVWFSLDVVETLLDVSEKDCYEDVRRLLDGAMKTCPDVLIANLAQAKPRWNGLRDDVFADLFATYIMGRPNAPAIMRHLWSVAPKLVLYASVKCFYAASSSQIISRLFALFRNTGDAFASAIHSNYFSFAISLAVMGANHDVLNLETWLVERLASQRTAFATSALAFVHRHYARAIPKGNVTPTTSHVLSIESLAIMLKGILGVQSALPPTIALELKRVITLCMEAHPVISTATRPADSSEISSPPPTSETPDTNVSTSSSPTFTAEMIEEQANAYFQQIYTSEQNINDVVAMLKRFQASREERERQIFYCMIHNLFDEYRFFPRYPEMELRITGVLFGKLIEHQVLPPNFLQTALRSVLESLREPATSKFFFFGAIALQQFIPRLKELPAYCTNLLQIPHLQQTMPDIVRHVQQITKTEEESKETPAPVEEEKKETKTPRPTSPKTISTPPQTSTPPVLNVDHIFHESTKEMEDNEELPQPIESVRDRIHFIVNNMSISNLEAKIPEVRKLLVDTYHPWMAQYLVVKRISTQPNYHGVFLVFIEKLNRPELEREILKRTFQNARKLLTSGTITNNSQQRSLLKNLGSWLGVFTLARNQPLLQRDLDLKELLYVGYETGHLIAVTPFVAKILEGCKKSKIFKPPNPWLMGMIHAMSEIYDVPDLKLNLKFEIEVLFKQFKLNVEDQRKAHLLHTRAIPPRVSNPDFNVKAPKMNTTLGFTGRSATPPHKLGMTKSLGSTTPSKPVKPGMLPSSSPPPRDAYSPSLSVGSSNTVSESTVIPNLASYVAVNPDLPLHNVNLRRLVPLAVDRAIREVISPVVERSVTIACITTREIILKDFATEVDDVKMRKAAHLMVASMSGSLALITAKEPLRNSIATHLRTLIPASAGDAQQIEHVIQVCSNENTDLGCMLIEKASSEKAMRDIDEAFGAAYASRRRHQQQIQGKPEGVHYFEGSAHQPPTNLPDVFKPKSGGVPHSQLVVYEAFQRIPRPTSMPSATRSTTPGATIYGDKEGLNGLGGLGLESSGAGVSVAAALDRFAGLMEKFEMFVQNVVRQATAAQRELPSLVSIPQESEVFAVLREVRAVGLAVKPALREEACLKIGLRIVKCMYELGGGRGDELFLEILVNSLEALCQSCDKLKKEITNWILRAPVEDKLKLHCEIIVSLVQYKVVEVSEFDLYLTRNMERNSVAIEFAVHIVRQCLTMEHVILPKQLPHTLEAFKTIVERHGTSSNKNVMILADLLNQARRPRTTGIGSKSGMIGTKSMSGGIGSSTMGGERQEHAAFRHTVSNAFEHWIAIYKEPSSNSKIHAQYIQMLKQYGLLNDDESISLFFRFGTELCVDACLKSTSTTGDKTSSKPLLNYAVIDALTHLMVLLVKYLDPLATTKLQVLNHAVGAIANVLVAVHDQSRKKKIPFDQRVFFRMFVNLMKDLTVQEPVLDAIHLQVLNTFASAFNTLQPMVLPGFVFAWTELISHRCFMPLLLRAKQQRGWQILHRLLMNLLVFLEPFLRHANAHHLSPSITALYQGTMRIVLVLLHDYPEFLGEFYTSFCDVLPSSTVQLRNVILSAFSRSLRLPDPLTFGLQVAQLPEVSVSPRLMPAWGTALAHNGVKDYVDEFLRATSNRAAVFPAELTSKLLRPQSQLELDPTSCKFSIPALNALVLYLGKEAIIEMANSSSSTSAREDAKNGPSVKFEQSASMDVFRFLADELDAEGRYWYISSLANHLRYPNAHTHYFSCVILYLFSFSTNKMVKEQITRVLIERLIANRPHPWGLLVTFIELIRNKSYKFWEQEYLECSAEIKEVFDDVARTCLGNSTSGQAMTPIASTS